MATKETSCLRNYSNNNSMATGKYFPERGERIATPKSKVDVPSPKFQVYGWLVNLPPPATYPPRNCRPYILRAYENPLVSLKAGNETLIGFWGGYVRWGLVDLSINIGGWWWNSFSWQHLQRAPDSKVMAKLPIQSQQISQNYSLKLYNFFSPITRWWLENNTPFEMIPFQVTF